MSDAGMGYGALLPNVNYGTPNPDTDSSPEARAALQEQYAQMAILRASEPGYVPPGTGYGASAPEWATQAGGPANLPITGWTVQNAQRPAFGPYDASHIGHIPDWTSDSNALAAGAYDMNETIRMTSRNDLNRAPVGDNESLFNYMEPPPPSTPTTDVSGQIGQDLEW